MARRRARRQAKPQELFATLVIVGGLFFVALISMVPADRWMYIFTFLLCVAALVGIGFYYFIYKRQLLKQRALQELQIADVDNMSGVAFEEYIAELFRKQNFHIETTATSGDFGVDLILRKDGERVAVQIKRYSKQVGLAAIQEAVAGMLHYGCSRSMVVTNNTFTNAAIKLAKSNNCMLVDRNELVEMIADQLKV